MPRVCGESRDDLVSLTSPKCHPHRVLRGVFPGVLFRRCTTSAMRLTTKSASWHAAMGSSWGGVLLVVEWDAVVTAKRHARTSMSVFHPTMKSSSTPATSRTTNSTKSRVVWAVLASLATESTPFVIRCCSTFACNVPAHRPVPGVQASPRGGSISQKPHSMAWP